MDVHRRLLATAALVLTTIVIAGPATASPVRDGIGPPPGSSQANLLIGASPRPGFYTVHVIGHIVGPAPSGLTVTFDLFGDDPVFDDDLGVSVSGFAVNGFFVLDKDVPRSVLNEDLAGTDEIYAQVTSSLGFSAITNTVSDNF